MNYESKCYAIVELCKAIIKLYNLNLSHNDLQPSNVVIDEEGKIKRVNHT